MPDRLNLVAPNPRILPGNLGAPRKPFFRGDNHDRNGEQSEGQRSLENPRPSRTWDSAKIQEDDLIDGAPAHTTKKPTPNTPNTIEGTPARLFTCNSSLTSGPCFAYSRMTAAIAERHHGQGHQNTIIAPSRKMAGNIPPSVLASPRFAGDKCQVPDIGHSLFEPIHRIRPADSQDLIERGAPIVRWRG